MYDTDETETRAVIPQKPPPPPRREAGEPLHPSDPIETPVPAAPPVEAPVTPAAPREASPSRPPASKRERSSDGRFVIPPRDSDPEIISRRDSAPMGRAANITTAALPLAAGDHERAAGLHLLGLPSARHGLRRR